MSASDKQAWASVVAAQQTHSERQARDEAYRAWWLAQRVDVRDLTPPPGACTGRVHVEGDPASPCVLALGHDGRCEDVEGYHEWPDL